MKGFNKIGCCTKGNVKVLFMVLLIAVFLAGSLAGCGSGGGGGGNGAQKSITGVASKGPISGGTVVVYALAADGTKGDLLGSATTGTDGSYSIDIGTYTGNVIVEVTGGTYKDEATGNTVPNTEKLRAALTNVSTSVSVAVTPLTEMAVSLAGTLTTSQIESMNSLVSAMIGVDIIGTMPVDVTGDVSAATVDQITYGLMLATISQMVKDGKASDVYAAISAIKNDLSDDNKLNATGGDILASLEAFYSNTNNNTGVNNPELTKLDDALTVISENPITPPEDTSDLDKAKALVADLRNTALSVYNYQGVGVPGVVETPFKNLAEELENKIKPELTDTVDRIAWIINAADDIDLGETREIPGPEGLYTLTATKSIDGRSLDFEVKDSGDAIIDSGSATIDDLDIPTSGTFSATMKTESGVLDASLNYSGTMANGIYTRMTFTGSMSAPGLSFDFSQEGRKLEATFAKVPGYYNAYLGVSNEAGASGITVYVSNDKEYAVYGGGGFNDWWDTGYHPVDFGYELLGTATGTSTFTNNYPYYFIVTSGFLPVYIDAIQFSDGSYYCGQWYFGWDSENIADKENICGPPDSEYAVLGGGDFNDSFPTSLFYSGRIRTTTAQMDGTLDISSVVWAEKGYEEDDWYYDVGSGTWEEEIVCIGEMRPKEATFTGAFEELMDDSPTGVKFSGTITGKWNNAEGYDGCSETSDSNFSNWEASFNGSIEATSRPSISTFLKVAQTGVDPENGDLDVGTLDVSYERINPDGSKVFLSGSGTYIEKARLIEDEYCYYNYNGEYNCYTSTYTDEYGTITATLTNQDGMTVSIDYDGSRSKDLRIQGTISSSGGSKMADLYNVDDVLIVKYTDNYLESIP